MSKKKKVLSKFTILCWATFVAILGCDLYTPARETWLVVLSHCRKLEERARYTALIESILGKRLCPLRLLTILKFSYSGLDYWVLYSV